MYPNRLVDSVCQPQQPTELQIIVIALPRTGSHTIQAALTQLGWNPLDRTGLRSHPIKFRLFEEAIRAKYFGHPDKYGRAEWDKVFAGYDCSCHPGLFIWDELIEQYPNAKVILLNRAVDKWEKSMAITWNKRLQWSSFDWLAPLDPTFTRLWWRFQKFENGMKSVLVPDGNERKFFQSFHETVRQTVSPERLLEFNVADGWDPLCKFLGVKPPSHPFPRVNDAEANMKGHRTLWLRTVCIVAAEFALAGGVAFAIIGYLTRK